MTAFPPQRYPYTRRQITDDFRLLWVGKKAIATERNQGGRPTGTRDTLRRGEVAALASVSKAIAAHGEGHPIVAECLETLLRIARGDQGYCGRHVGDRLRAITRLLDTLVGTPHRARDPGGADEGGELKQLMDAIDDGQFEPDGT